MTTETLVAKLTELAKSKDIRYNHLIYNAKELEALRRNQPTSLKELAKIKGFGLNDRRYAEHGQDICDIFVDTALSDERESVSDHIASGVKNTVNDALGISTDPLNGMTRYRMGKQRLTRAQYISLLEDVQQFSKVLETDINNKSTFAPKTWYDLRPIQLAPGMQGVEQFVGYLQSIKKKWSGKEKGGLVASWVVPGGIIYMLGMIGYGAMKKGRIKKVTEDIEDSKKQYAYLLAEYEEQHPETKGENPTYEEALELLQSDVDDMEFDDEEWEEDSDE